MRSLEEALESVREKDSRPAHVKKMQSRGELHFLYNDSPFVDLSVEEFEGWKYERGLCSEELHKFRERRAEVIKICEMYLIGYYKNSISLTGPKGLIESLNRICTESESTIFAETIRKALTHASEKGKGPSFGNEKIKVQLAGYISFLKQQKRIKDSRLHESADKSGITPMLGFPESITRNGKIVPYPGKCKEDYMVFILERYRNLGLEEVVPNIEFIREHLRS